MRGRLAKQIRRYTDFVRKQRVSYSAIEHKRYVPDLTGALVVRSSYTIYLGDCDRALYQATKKQILRGKRAA